MGKNVDDLGCENDFLDITQKAQSMKERIDKLVTSLKLKPVLEKKNTIQMIKRQVTD